MAPAGLIESFVAAIQASVSVLLVILYGAVAAWLGLLDAHNTKALSKTCVRIFLPALLFTKIGAQLNADGDGGGAVVVAHRYGLVLLWALLCHAVSFALGIVAHVGLGMPDWTTVAVMFNNTLSYPLLLIGALDETGILGPLVVGGDGHGTTAEAIERAKSYFLVFATVSSCLTFAVGPRLIDSEHAPEEEDRDNSFVVGGVVGDGDGDGNGAAVETDEVEEDNHGGDDEEQPNERTALLTPDGPSSPSPQIASPLSSTSSSSSPSLSKSFFPSTRKVPKKKKEEKKKTDRRPPFISQKHWSHVPPRAKWWILFTTDFFNAPLLGAILGAIVGLVPALHRAFFASSADGGVLTAWLTASLRSIAALFVPLPVVIAGVSLFTSFAEARRRRGIGIDDNNNNDDDLTTQTQSARLPRAAVAFILLVRFVVWPVLSIAVIYAFASRTRLLGDDPMLWFAMMLMPTGPPAMKLITLVQVSEADEGEEASIAKILTISYLISPILSFTVVGALMASQACI